MLINVGNTRFLAKRKPFFTPDAGGVKSVAEKVLTIAAASLLRGACPKRLQSRAHPHTRLNKMMISHGLNATSVRRGGAEPHLFPSRQKEVGGALPHPYERQGNDQFVNHAEYGA